VIDVEANACICRSAAIGCQSRNCLADLSQAK
jgi:hypothetical protein